MLGASLLSVGVSNAAGGRIKACVMKTDGSIRVIDSSKKCNASERTLTWGTKGPRGAKGSTGATGATGSAGSNGATGASGISYATFTTNSLVSDMARNDQPYLVASLDNLSAGSYLLQATIELMNRDLIGRVDCRFFIAVGTGQFMSSPYAVSYIDTSIEEFSMSVNYAIMNLSGGTYDKVDFQCYVMGSPTEEVMVNTFFMSATKVDTLVNQ